MTATAVPKPEKMAPFEVCGGPERLVYEPPLLSAGGHFTHRSARWPGPDPVFLAQVEGVAVELTERRELRFTPVSGGSIERITELSVATDAQRLFAAVEKGDTTAAMAAHTVVVEFAGFGVRMRADKIGFPSAELWPALFGRPAPAGDILELLTAFLHGFVPALIGPATAEEYPHERYYRAARTGFEVMTAAVVEVESKPARKRKAR